MPLWNKRLPTAWVLHEECCQLLTGSDDCIWSFVTNSKLSVEDRRGIAGVSPEKGHEEGPQEPRVSDRRKG